MTWLWSRVLVRGNRNFCSIHEGVASCIIQLNRECTQPIKDASGVRSIQGQLFDVQKSQVPVFKIVGLSRVGGGSPAPSLCAKVPGGSLSEFRDGEPGGYSICACVVMKAAAVVGYSGETVPDDNAKAILGVKAHDDRKRDYLTPGSAASDSIFFPLAGASHRGVLFSKDRWIPFGEGVPSDSDGHTIPYAFEVQERSGILPSTRLVLVRDLLARQGDTMSGGGTPIVGRLVRLALSCFSLHLFRCVFGQVSRL